MKQTRRFLYDRAQTEYIYETHVTETDDKEQPPAVSGENRFMLLRYSQII